MAPGDVTVQVSYPRGFNGNRFDGVDDYIEIPHSDRQLGSQLQNGFTISAWINPISAGENSRGRILDKSTNTTAASGFRFSNTTSTSKAKLIFQINGGTAKESATDSITFGIWQHVLITISSGQLANFYVNGVLSGTANQDLVQTISTITTINTLRIANDSATTSTFNGSIKDVKMWNKVLSTDEIAQDYAGVTPAQANLIHFFKLGGDYTDYGFVGVTATNSGSVPVIQEDQVASAIKIERGLTDISGAFMICPLGIKREQILSVGIQKT